MIFLDHAATAAIDPRVREFYLAELEQPQNPSSVHRHGQAARARLDSAREEMAELLQCEPSGIVFTSGATEAANLALRGLAGHARRESRPFRVATSALEHSCVRETLHALGEDGLAELCTLPVGRDGRADVEALRGGETDVLCLMAVQNETGVVQSLARAAELRSRHSFLWFCDATQAFSRSGVSLRDPGPDLVVLSSHKLHGPPGVGILAGRAVRLLRPQITGGPQENERRAGTQPVAAIRAFVMAARLAAERRDELNRHLATLEETFLAGLRAEGVEFAINGAAEYRLPGFLSLSFRGFAGPDLVIALDGRGYSVSAGSACATGVMEVSPVLAAMYPSDPERARGALRITPGSGNTTKEMAGLAAAIAAVVRTPRRRRAS